MSDCRFGVSPVNYPNPDTDEENSPNVTWVNTFVHDMLTTIFVEVFNAISSLLQIKRLILSEVFKNAS